MPTERESLSDARQPCGHPKSDETSADGYTFCAVCAVRPSGRYPELRRALAGDERAIAALGRLEAGLGPVRAVVERYGRVWAKDTDYYAAAEVLGIKEPPGMSECERLGRHVCGSCMFPNCADGHGIGRYCDTCGAVDAR